MIHWNETLANTCIDCECVNGHCSEGMCLCDEGYEKTTFGGSCTPECNIECTSKVCTAPNVCLEEETTTIKEELSTRPVELVEEEEQAEDGLDLSQERTEEATTTESGDKDENGEYANQVQSNASGSLWYIWVIIAGGLVIICTIVSAVIYHYCYQTKSLYVGDSDSVTVVYSSGSNYYNE